MSELPITAILSELFLTLAASQQVILQAPPGAGKSTYLPLQLLKQNMFKGKILMLEPRRLATRNIAQFMAGQLNEKVGQQVGYRMRGDTKVSATTQLEVVTEGILLRIMQQDPELSEYDLIIFDEFHERSLNADMGLAFALEIQQGLREDLKLLVMSATLDSEKLQQLLPDAALLTSEGRGFPITYSYHAPNLQGRNLNQAIISAVVSVVQQALQEREGCVLVFLPGVSEIKRCLQQLQILNLSADILPLYGQLSFQAQQQAIAPSPVGHRKVVLATNIAETSLTIEGISVVIDSGLERRVSFTPRSGISKLTTRRISLASATQRAGRAGRLQAGHCYRLWRQEDHERLEAQITPEIVTAELTNTLLELKVWGLTDFTECALLDQPITANVQHAEQLLTELGALENKQCSPHGQAIADLGMSPRLAHMLIQAQQWEAEIPGISWLACRVIALLESSERLPLDLDFALQQLESGQFSQAEKQAKQWASRFHIPKAGNVGAGYLGLLLALAFPDRIGKRRRHDSQQYLLSNGLGVQALQDNLRDEYIVVTDLSLSERGADAQIYNAASVDVALLETYLPDLIQQHEHVAWDLKNQKLLAERQLKIGNVVLSKQALTTVSETQKQQALLSGIRQAGLAVLPWDDNVNALLTRLRCAHNWLEELGFIDFSESVLLTDLENWLQPYLTGVTGPAQMKKIPLADALLSRLDWQLQQQLAQLLPTHFTVPTGSKVKLRYIENGAPSLPVRIQEMFGQASKPSVAQGRIAITIELLSPAMRPLQLTQDLLGFWQGSYNEVKKEMKGRYPKHYWPDNPLEAMPTKRVKKHM